LTISYNAFRLCSFCLKKLVADDSEAPAAPTAAIKSAEVPTAEPDDVEFEATTEVVDVAACMPSLFVNALTITCVESIPNVVAATAAEVFKRIFSNEHSECEPSC
jgi:hypothetical protein